MRPTGVRRLFRFVSRSAGDVEADLREEFAFHLDMRTRDLIAGGMTPEAARQQALREFGSVERGAAAIVDRDARRERRLGLARLLGEVRQDAGYGLRLIGRGPAFTLVAVLTLALAIGANTAVFSLANALLFKPLPIADPGRLVRVYPGESGISWLNLADVRERSTAFDGVVAQRNLVPAVAWGGDPVRVTGAAVSANYFDVLGVPPLLGRAFRASDTRADVIVLSERFWRTRLNQDPAVVGRTIVLDGRVHEVLAVMPRGFGGMAPPGFGRDLWIPVDPSGMHRRLANDRASTGFEAYARLRPGVDTAAASAALRVIGAQLEAEHPEINQRFDRLEALPTSGFAGLRGVSALMPVFVFVTLSGVIAALILLVACANLAGLLLGRAAARRREIAVRAALGAGRRRIVRQLLTESLILASMGGAAGLLVAAGLTSAVPLATSRLPFPVELDLSLDRRVLVFTVVVVCVATVLFGLAPARQAARRDLAGALKDLSRVPGRQRLHRMLVVAQVAAGSALLVWGGLFLRSLGNVAAVDPGFRTDGVWLVELPIGELAGPNAGDAARVEVARELHETAMGMPGVQAAGMCFAVPLALSAREEYAVRLPGDAEGGPSRRVMGNTVTPGYFGAIRIPLVAGRDFTWRDRAEAPGVAIVNQAAARRFWNGNAIGQRIDVPGQNDRWRTVEVVGVVRDSKYWTLGEAVQPTLYTPYAQGLNGNTLAVRTTNMEGTAAALRAELRRRAPGRPVEFQRMSDAVAIAVLPARIGALVTTAFAAVAMFLAVMGIYALVAFGVALRVREIGIRKAVGARTRDIAGVLLAGSAPPVLAGLVLGIAAGSLIAFSFGGLVVGVPPYDPAVLAAVTAVVSGTSLAAGFVPAWRAARVDPLVALRPD